MTILEAIRAAREAEHKLYLPGVEPGECHLQIDLSIGADYEDIHDLCYWSNDHGEWEWGAHVSVADMLRTDWALDDPTKGRV